MFERVVAFLIHNDGPFLEGSGHPIGSFRTVATQHGVLGFRFQVMGAVTKALVGGDDEKDGSTAKDQRSWVGARVFGVPEGLLHGVPVDVHFL